MEEQDDPFASLTKRCKPTPSQEEILKTCPFSRQSEVFPADSDDGVLSPSLGPLGIPVDPTGIIMVSPPEEFQTPQEDSLPAASSEDQRPQPPTAVDGGGENLSLSCAVAERAVDLGKDSDDMLGLSGTEVVDGVGDSCNGVDGVLGGFDATTAGKEAVITERTSRVDDDAVMTEVVDLEVEELGEDNVFVDLPLRETEVDNRVALSGGDGVVKNGNGDLVRKNIEDLDKFRYVGPSGVVNRKVVGGVGGRRELPPSIRKGANVAGEKTRKENLAAKDKIFKGLLDALKMVAGQLDGGGSEEEEEEDVDFLETAKRHGMTLPRPRWWPPEDYDD